MASNEFATTSVENAPYRTNIIQEPRESRRPAARVKGSVFRAHLDWVRHHRSREETIEFYEALSSDVRHLVAGLISSEWFPAAALLEVDRVIIDQFGSGSISFAQHLGKYLALTMLVSARPLPRPFEIHATLQNIATGQSEYEDLGGRARYVPGSKFTGVVVRLTSSIVSPILCAAASGFYAECLRVYGCTSIEVSEPDCQTRGEAVCRFDLRWKQR